MFQTAGIIVVRDYRLAPNMALNIGELGQLKAQQHQAMDQIKGMSFVLNHSI